MFGVRMRTCRRGGFVMIASRCLAWRAATDQRLNGVRSLAAHERTAEHLRRHVRVAGGGATVVLASDSSSSGTAAGRDHSRHDRSHGGVLAR